MDSTLEIDGRQKTDYDLQTHLSDYFSIIVKQKWIVIGCFLAIVAAAAIFSLMSASVYEATVQIMISEQPSPNNPMGENSGRGFSQDEYFQTQVNLLLNRKLAEEVILELKLENAIYGELYDDEEKIVAARSSEKDKSQLDPDLIDWYLDYVEVVPVRDSNLVNIHFYGKDPALITEMANTHAQAAKRRNVEFQRKHAGELLKWLKSQIEKQKFEVEKAQKKVHDYKKKNDLISDEDSENLISLELDAINADLIEARNLCIAKQAAFDQLKSAGLGPDGELILPEIINDSVILNLRNRLVELNARKIEMATKYGPKHPKMIQLNLGINQLKNEIGIEIRRLKNAIQADLKRAKSIETDLQKTLNQKKKAAMDLGEKGIEYEVLRRQADTNDEIYDFLLKQSEEINLSSLMDASSIQIVSKARIPKDPVKPNLAVNIAIAGLFGLLFSTGLAFFIEYMDTSIKSQQDVVSKIRLPVLGLIPYDKKLEENAALALPWNQDTRDLKREYKATPYYPTSKRFPILFKPDGENNTCARIVTIESATMQEGKTTIAIKAAASMAASGMSVLLIDGDLIRPRLSQTFGVHNGNGLTSLIKKISTFEIQSGDLSGCSLDDLFFLIGLKRKNGNLIVTNSDNQCMEILFQNGRMIHLQNLNNKDANRLGTMLSNSGLISVDQLQDALERNKRTGQPLGYILVNSGYLTRDKLRGPLRLQMEENLYKLFSWKSGSYEFRSGTINTYNQERITFEEEYTGTIRMLGKLEGSRLVQTTIFSQISKWYAENLYILPAGYGGENNDFTFNLFLMKKVLGILKQNFDVIIIDTSPIEAQADTITMSSLADDIIFVIKAGKLSYKILNQAKSTLPQDKIVGAILNQVKLSGSSYYNYY